MPRIAGKTRISTFQIIPNTEVMKMMNWTSLWLQLFGTTTWLNIDIGFWISMGASVLVAILMVIVFWSRKSYQTKE